LQIDLNVPWFAFTTACWHPPYLPGMGRLDVATLVVVFLVSAILGDAGG
jgi:hypothetical protein